MGVQAGGKIGEAHEQVGRAPTAKVKWTPNLCPGITWGASKITDAWVTHLEVMIQLNIK